jgi:predicted TIM-barrel fold metal-dependent hydrolase
MVVVDCHTHMGPPLYPIKEKKWDAEELLSLMDQNGVDVAIVTSTQTADLKSANDRLQVECSKARGRLLPFVRVNPNLGKTALDEIEMRVKTQKWKGIKLHPTLSGFPIDSAIGFSVFEKASQLGVPVLVHAGSEIYNTPAQVALAAETYPDVTVIMAHMGANELVEQSIIAAKRRGNIVLDTTAQPIPALIKKAVEERGPKRVVFGSDVPYLSQKLELMKIDMAGLSHEELRWVKGDAIMEILSGT